MVWEGVSHGRNTPLVVIETECLEIQIYYYWTYHTPYPRCATLYILYAREQR